MVGSDDAELLLQAINTHNRQLPRRFLDEFTYSEQLSANVLLQVSRMRNMYNILMFLHEPVVSSIPVLVIPHDKMRLNCCRVFY